MSINYVQMHIGDFLSGVMHMDGTEIGAYTMLIMAHYQAGEQGLPDDDQKLTRIARVSPKVWKRIRETVLDKFFYEDGCWKHERILTEIEKIRGKAGSGRPRSEPAKNPESDPTTTPKSDTEKPFLGSQLKNKSLKNNDSQKTNQEPITNNQYITPPMGPPHENPVEGKEPDSHPAKIPKARTRDPTEIPNFIDGDLWMEWDQHRREKRSELTETTVKRQIQQLKKWKEKGYDPNDIIRRSITNGWVGLFEPKPGDNGRARPGSSDYNKQQLREWVESG